MKNYKLHFYLYLISIILGSSIPGRSVPNLFLFSWDKLLHVAEYFIFGVLAINSISITTKRTVYTLIPCGILFAFMDEYLQSFISGRFSSGLDILSDTLGFSVGLILVYLWQNDK